MPAAAARRAAAAAAGAISSIGYTTYTADNTIAVPLHFDAF